VTEREYLVSLGLAKPGRGRFSAAAKAALDEAKSKGKTFDDTKPSSTKSTPRAKPATSKPEAKPEQKPETDETPAPKWDAKAVRKWAEAQGIEVPSRGRLPKDVLEAYAKSDNPEEAKAKVEETYYDPPQTTTASKFYGRVGDIIITRTWKDACNGCGYSLRFHTCGQPRALMVDGTYVPLSEKPLA